MGIDYTTKTIEEVRVSVCSMRIAVIAPNFPPMIGGLSDYTLAWCRSVNQHHDVHIEVITRSSAAQPIGIKIGAPVDRWSWRGRGALFVAIAQARPDIVVLQYVPHAFSRRGGGLSFALALYSALRRLEVPLVTHAHELTGEFGRALHRYPWLIAQRVAVHVLVAISAQSVVTVGGRQARLQLRFVPYQDRIKCIPIGPTIAPTARDPMWRQRYEISDDTLIVVTFGLGHASHDMSVLPRLLDECIERGLDVRLVVFGHALVEHPLCLTLGFVDEKQAAAVMADSDLAAFNIKDGASGRRSVVISALGAGLPVVSTRGPDTDDAWFPASGIKLTKAGDDDAFVEAVIELLQDTSARDSLRSGGRLVFDAHFSWQTVSEEWLRVLRTALGAECRKDGRSPRGR